MVYKLENELTHVDFSLKCKAKSVILTQEHMDTGQHGHYVVPHVAEEVDLDSDSTLALLNVIFKLIRATHTREITPCGECGLHVQPPALVEFDQEVDSIPVD